MSEKRKKNLLWIEENAEGIFEGFLRFLALVIMTVQIVTRYFFNNPLVWTEEVSRFLNIFAVMTSLSWAIRLRCEMKVTIVVDLLPKVLKTIIHEIMYFLGFVIVIYMFYSGIQVVEAAKLTGQIGAATELPYWIIYLSAPIGFGCAIIRYIQQYFFKIRNIVRRSRGEEVEEIVASEEDAEVEEVIKSEQASIKEENKQ
ncbi:MAG: TRAP transporter small permease [Lachnospiraceae bacterium]|nr:TRAP transporter small permease [Candidatus Minthocola equi]